MSSGLIISTFLGGIFIYYLLFYLLPFLHIFQLKQSLAFGFPSIEQNLTLLLQLFEAFHLFYPRYQFSNSLPRVHFLPHVVFHPILSCPSLAGTILKLSFCLGFQSCPASFANPAKGQTQASNFPPTQSSPRRVRVICGSPLLSTVFMLKCFDSI